METSLNSNNQLQQLLVLIIASIAMLIGSPVFAATDLGSAVTELSGTFATASGPALDFVVAALAFMLAPKILVRIFYLVF